MRLAPIMALLIATPAVGQQFGEWALQKERDPITDETKLVAFTPGANLDRNRPAFMGFACITATPLALLIIDRPAFDGRAEVLWRIDREPPVESAQWEVSDDVNLSVRGEEAIKLLLKARPGDSLYVRATTSAGTDTYGFSLRGLTAASRDLPCYPNEATR